jgi:hypothetical protein
MAVFRPHLLVCLCTSVVTLAGVACSSSNTPTGPHYQYVANQVNVPTTTAQESEWGLDLNGGGSANNALGAVFVTLGQLGFNVQEAVNAGVANGSITLLLDLQTPSFTSASAAGISVFIGGSASTPPACNGSSDTYTCTGSGSAQTCTGCAHQFSGSASFTVDSSAMTNPPLVGPIKNGTMTGGPGGLSISIALTGAPIQINLIGAKVQASGLSATALGSTTGTQPNQSSSDGATFGGGLTVTELDNTVMPAIVAQIASTMAAECPGCPGGAACVYTNNPPCNCTGTAATIVSVFAGASKSCVITAQDLENNTLVKSVLSPDVTIDGMPALSIGLNVTAVGAQFTAP